MNRKLTFGLFFLMMIAGQLAFAQTTADLQVTKTDAPDPVTAGENITYTIVVTNLSTTETTGTVTITDPIPTNTTFVSATGTASTCTFDAVTETLTCTVASLAPGATETVTLVVEVDANVASGSIITNAATATAASNTDPNAANNTGITATTTTQTEADLAVTKTGAPEPVNAGDQLTYTIDIDNLGPSDAQNVELTDLIPAGTTFVSVTPEAATCTAPAVGGTGTVTCTLATLAAGQDEIITLVVEVNANVPSGTIIENTAAVTSDTTDPNALNNAATDQATVATEADLAVTKTGDPDRVIAGEQLTYTIDIDNLGPSDAQTVELTDVLPAETTFVSVSGEASTCTYDAATTTVTCTLATLAAGQDEIITLVVDVNADVLNGTLIANTATVTTATTDPNAANNQDIETNQVLAETDLTITKTGATDVSAGNQTQYTITVTNQGPSDAQDVVMEDVLPAGTTFVDITEPAGFTCVTPAAGATGTVTCTAATLAADATAVFVLTVAIDPNLPSGTAIENTATVTSTTPDPTPGDNTATVTARALVPGIPTMSEWGLLAMMMALAAFGALRLRS